MAIQDQIKGRLNQYEISVEDAKMVLESILGASKVLRGHKLSHRRRELFKEFQDHLMNIIRLAQVDLTERQMDRNALLDNEKCMKADEGYREALLKKLKAKNELLDQVQLKSAKRCKACNIKNDVIYTLKAEIESLHKANSVAVMDRNTVQQKLDNVLYDMNNIANNYNKLIGWAKAQNLRPPTAPTTSVPIPSCCA